MGTEVLSSAIPLMCGHTLTWDFSVLSLRKAAPFAFPRVMAQNCEAVFGTVSTLSGWGLYRAFAPFRQAVCATVILAPPCRRAHDKLPAYPRLRRTDCRR